MQTELYSIFDENGIPTHDASGKEFNENQYNGLKKEFNAHQKKYEKNQKTLKK